MLSRGKADRKRGPVQSEALSLLFEVPLAASQWRCAIGRMKIMDRKASPQKTKRSLIQLSMSRLLSIALKETLTLLSALRRPGLREGKRGAQECFPERNTTRENVSVPPYIPAGGFRGLGMIGGSVFGLHLRPRDASPGCGTLASETKLSASQRPEQMWWRQLVVQRAGKAKAPLTGTDQLRRQAVIKLALPANNNKCHGASECHSATARHGR